MNLESPNIGYWKILSEVGVWWVQKLSIHYFNSKSQNAMSKLLFHICICGWQKQYSAHYLYLVHLLGFVRISLIHRREFWVAGKNIIHEEHTSLHPLFHNPPLHTILFFCSLGHHFVTWQGSAMVYKHEDHLQDNDSGWKLLAIIKLP